MLPLTPSLMLIIDAVSYATPDAHDAGAYASADVTRAEAAAMLDYAFHYFA